MVELIIITLIGLTCLGIGLKYCIYKGNVVNENEVITNTNLIIIAEDENQDYEPPPKYEDI